MDILEKIAKKFKLVPEKTTTEQILEKRGDLKIQIAVSLYNKGFSDDEIKTVLGIIIDAEEKIQQIKDSLEGTNINPDETKDPMQPIIDGRKKIQEISLKMNEEIRDTISLFSKNHTN